MASFAPDPDPAPRIQEHLHLDLRDDREQLFRNLARPETSPDFVRRVADDVDWTVEGTHPLAGRFTTKKAFNEATFDRIAPLLREGARLELQHLLLDGTTTIAELRATSTTLDGSPYDNTLCWICRFDSAEAGAMIVEVRAYLDSAMVAWTIMRNEQLRT